MRIAAIALIAACSYDRPERIGSDAPPEPCLIDNGGCSINATCAAPQGTAVCTCKPGFVGDGRACQPVWQLLWTVSGIELDTGFGASVVAVGSKIYFAPDDGSTGIYFKSIDTQSGAVADHPLPPLYNASQNEFCACGNRQMTAALAGEIFLFGNDAASFETSTETWTARSSQYPAAVRRSEATAVTANGRIYLHGGASTRTSVAYYTPAAGFTTDPIQLPFELTYGAGAVIGTTVYVFGGEPPQSNKSARRDVASSSQWETLAISPEDISFGDAAVFNDKIIVGGYYVMGVLIYEPASNTWKSLGTPAGLVYKRVVQVGAEVYLIAEAAGPKVEVYKLMALP